MPDDGVGPGFCPICRKPFQDGDVVVQVVEDRFPDYDREVVLHTYHRVCFHAGETVMHDCPRCGCMFHLALIRQGEELPQPHAAPLLPLLRHALRLPRWAAESRLSQT